MANSSFNKSTYCSTLRFFNKSCFDFNDDFEQKTEKENKLIINYYSNAILQDQR